MTTNVTYIDTNFTHYLSNHPTFNGWLASTAGGYLAEVEDGYIISTRRLLTHDVVEGVESFSESKDFVFLTPQGTAFTTDGRIAYMHRPVANLVKPHMLSSINEYANLVRAYIYNPTKSDLVGNEVHTNSVGYNYIIFNPYTQAELEQAVSDFFNK